MLMKPRSSTLTLRDKIINRITGEPNHISHAEHGDLVGTSSVKPMQYIMNAKCSSLEELDVYRPILRVWILRMLILLDGHREFISKNGFRNAGIAKLLGVTDGSEAGGKDSENKSWSNAVDYDVPDTNEIEAALQMALDSFDSSDKLSTVSYDKFCPDLALAQLKSSYQESEKQLDKIQLPQPLASNIKQLTDLLSFSAAEYWILAFTVLMCANQELEDAYELLKFRKKKRGVVKILSTILGFSAEEIRNALSKQSALLTTSLVTLGCCYDPVPLSSDFAERLLIENGSPLEWLREMISLSPTSQLSLSDYPHIKDSLDFLLPYLQQSLESDRKGVNVFIYGLPGTGKTQLTRVLAEALACPLYEIAGSDNEGYPLSGENRLRISRATQMIFQRQSFLMLFDEAEDVFKNYDSLGSIAQKHKAWTNGLLEDNPKPIIWVANSVDGIDPAFIRRFDWIIEVPVAPSGQREQIIRNSCGAFITDHAIKNLATCNELTPAVITRAAKVIGSLSDQFSVEQLSSATEQLIDTTLKAQGHHGHYQQTPKSRSLIKVGKFPDVYDPELINCDADLKQIAKGIMQVGNARLCLFGPSGTGKTAYSRWLAEQLNKPLIVKRGSDLLNMWVGGTEHNIAEAFQQADAEKAVLLIDEVDSFLQERNVSQHSWELTAVNEMLTQMEAYEGIFIATTNRMNGLDVAALRRFDLKVKFDALNPLQAWKLLQSYCQALGISMPDESIQSQLIRLENLTLGDFAILERQHPFKPISDAKSLIAALQAESALKMPYQRQPIGFV